MQRTDEAVDKVRSLRAVLAEGGRRRATIGAVDQGRAVRLTRRSAGLLTVVLSLLFSIPSPAVALSWGPVRAITSDNLGLAFPGSTVAYSGGVAVAYRDIVGGEYGSYVRRSTDGGTTWTSPTQLNVSGTMSSRPQLAAAGNTLDAVFWQSTDDAATSRIIYRTSANGGTTWSSPITLSPSGTQAGSPSVARVGSQVVVAWTNAITGRVGVRTSGDGGITFHARTDVATTVNQPGAGNGDFSLEAWPGVIYSDGVINLAYRTSESTLKLRRSGNNGGSWTPAITLASNADLLRSSLAASGRTVLIAYTVDPTSTLNGRAVYRRSGNAGQSWSSPVAFSGGSAPPTGSPVVVFRSSAWRVAFERCTDNECFESQVYYRQSASGSSWGAATKVTNGPSTYQFPAGVTQANGKTIVVFDSADSTVESTNVLVRQGS